MELPNRKQRRAWAKQMGLLKDKSKLPLIKQLEINRRTMEAGKQIHLRNVERNLERSHNLKEEKTQALMQTEVEDLVAQGHTMEEAMAIVSAKNDENDGTLDS